MTFIEISQVVKKYGDFTALHGIDLSIEEGEFLCLLGPSGCGKTTLMRSIAGLETIEGGSIVVGGELFSESGYRLPSERRKLGMVFQSYALWPHMTVFKNIAYTLRTNGWARSAVAGRVDEVLDIVGLKGMEKRYPAQLSGGQMQRVALARSIAPEPRVLLFDEPLSNLDSKLREKMRFELRQIQQRVGITAIYVTHDQSEAMVVADRIALMRDGMIQQLGVARDLYERPTSRFGADFMGVTNFVDADLVDVGSGEPRLRWPGDVVVAGEIPPDLCDTGRVVTAVRPEHVKVSTMEPAAGADASVVRGELTEVIYLGHLSEVYVRVGGSVLRSQMVPDQTDGWDTGMPVWVQLDRRRVRAIEATGTGKGSGVGSAAGAPTGSAAGRDR